MKLAHERFEPFYVDVKGVQEVMASRKPGALWFMAHQVFMKVQTEQTFIMCDIQGWAQLLTWFT